MPRQRRYTEKEFDAAVAAVVEQRNQALFENRRLKAALDRVIADAERLTAVVGEQFAAETAPAVVEGTAGAHPRLRAVPSTPTPKETA